MRSMRAFHSCEALEPARRRRRARLGEGRAEGRAARARDQRRRAWPSSTSQWYLSGRAAASPMSAHQPIASPARPQPVHALDFAPARRRSSRGALPAPRAGALGAASRMPGGRLRRAATSACALARRVRGRRMFVPDGAKPEEVGKGGRAPRRAGPSSRCATCSPRAGSTCRASTARTRRAAGSCSRTWATTRSPPSSRPIPTRSEELYVRAVTDLAQRAERRSRRCRRAASSRRAPSTRTSSLGDPSLPRVGARGARHRALAARTARRFDGIAGRLARAHRRLAARLRPPRLPVAQPHGARPSEARSAGSTSRTRSSAPASTISSPC